MGQTGDRAVDHNPDFLRARAEGVSGIRVLSGHDIGARGEVAGGEGVGGLRRREAKAEEASGQQGDWRMEDGEWTPDSFGGCCAASGQAGGAS